MIAELTKKFKTYLQGQAKSNKLSNSSIKNYISDINHFLNWLKSRIQEDKITSEHITSGVIKNYAQYLAKPDTSSSFTNHNLSNSTIKRYLSSLKRFGLFLEKTGLCNNNPTENLTSPQNLIKSDSINSIINKYKAFLKQQELSHSTIKNYVSDLKIYLKWTQTHYKTTDNSINVRS